MRRGTMSSRFALRSRSCSPRSPPLFGLSYSRSVSGFGEQPPRPRPRRPRRCLSRCRRPRHQSPSPIPGRAGAPRLSRRSVPLRVRPNGHVVTRVGTSTEFGSARVLSVAAQRGPWLGVVDHRAAERAARLGAPRNAGLRLRRTRLLPARRPVRTAASSCAGTGACSAASRSPSVARAPRRPPAASRSPTSSRGGSYGPYYGCCILALNGHQPKLAGRAGRAAIASRSTARTRPARSAPPASAGCLRAADSDLERPDAPRAAGHAGVHQELSF